MGDRLYNKFHHAIRIGHVRNVKHFVLNEGLSFNHMFADGSFPLHIAAEIGDDVLVSLMLSLKASPDLKNRHGQTALMHGVEHARVVEALVNANARVNLADEQRRTALHLAASHVNPGIMKSLIAAGGRVNQLDRWGRTPLHVLLLNSSSACRAHNTDSVVAVVDVLLQSKADVNICDHHNYTPLFLAVNSNIAEVVLMVLRRGAHPDRISRHKLTPLYLAVMKGYTDVCLVLLRYNVNVNVHSYKTGKLCFQMAVEKGFLTICKALWEAGCDVYKINSDRLASLSSSDSRDVTQWLHSVIFKPMTLKHLCRTALRRCFGHDIQEKVAVLDYPQQLKDYILVTHMYGGNVQN